MIVLPSFSSWNSVKPFDGEAERVGELSGGGGVEQGGEGFESLLGESVRVDCIGSDENSGRLAALERGEDSRRNRTIRQSVSHAIWNRSEERRTSPGALMMRR